MLKNTLSLSSFEFNTFNTSFFDGFFHTFYYIKTVLQTFGFSSDFVGFRLAHPGHEGGTGVGESLQRPQRWQARGARYAAHVVYITGYP